MRVNRSGAPDGAPNHYSQMARRSYEGIDMVNSMTPGMAKDGGAQAPATNPSPPALACSVSEFGAEAIGCRGKR
jgi:hypothetical protein